MQSMVEIERKKLGAQLCEIWENDPEFIKLVAGQIREALYAQTERFDMGSKAWIGQPDRRTRLEAIKLILAYSDGLPLQRSISVELGKESLESVSDMLRSSPATMEAMKREIEKAQWRSKGGPKKKFEKLAAPADEVPS